MRIPFLARLFSLCLLKNIIYIYSRFVGVFRSLQEAFPRAIPF